MRKSGQAVKFVVCWPSKLVDDKLPLGPAVDEWSGLFSGKIT
jgi:hypothetical protein